MIEVLRTEAFIDWLRSLRDRRAQQRIAMRIARVESGLIGDSKSVGGGVAELRIDYGPGYRLYYTKRGDAIILLLCGGDKSSQQRDIAKAQALAANLET